MAAEVNKYANLGFLRVPNTVSNQAVLVHSIVPGIGRCRMDSTLAIRPAKIALDGPVSMRSSGCFGVHMLGILDGTLVVRMKGITAWFRARVKRI